MTLSSISSAGARTENEDSLGAEAGQNAWFAIVCDGLGGHGGGDRASRGAVDAALASFSANPALAENALKDHLAAAQARVREVQQATPEIGSMRTTAVAILSDGSTAFWGHAGDSRLYHFRNGRILSQTSDHSVPQSLAAAGEIEPAAIRFHEDRNRVLRALGTPGELKPTYSGPVAIGAGDAFLLCTDGFWEWVLEEEMQASLTGDPAAWLNAMEQRLVAKATGEYDNYSALAIVI
jgi:serine/threonine protein phosphatase PrpC